MVGQAGDQDRQMARVRTEDRWDRLNNVRIPTSRTFKDPAVVPDLIKAMGLPTRVLVLLVGP